MDWIVILFVVGLLMRPLWKEIGNLILKWFKKHKDKF